jgi:hypothetical protein
MKGSSQQLPGGLQLNESGVGWVDPGGKTCLGVSSAIF